MLSSPNSGGSSLLFHSVTMSSLMDPSSGYFSENYAVSTLEQNICVCVCVCVVDEDGAGGNEG